MEKIKAILFDMDGVLIDAKEWHYISLNRALNHFGVPISKQDHLTTYDGIPTRDKLKILSSEGIIPEELHDFISELKQTYTIQLVHQLCKPNFFHEYALSRLSEMGYLLGVCSNSVTASIKTMLEKAHILKYFDITISNQDVSCGKPDPEMYLLAMRKLGIHASEALILEDNINGINAARASGGHLMIVKEVNDVNLDNIVARITSIEQVQ